MPFGPILHDFLFCEWIDARGLIAEELSQLRTELDSQVGTILAAVARGDILVGNSTPAWGSLAIGGANTVLRSNGTDPAWGKVVLSTDVSGILAAINGGTGFGTYTTGDLLYAASSVALGKLSAGPAGYVLTSNGAGFAPAWKPLNIPVFFPDGDGGDESIAAPPLQGVGTTDTRGWSVLTNGDPVTPELVFDSDGDVIMTRTP